MMRRSKLPSQQFLRAILDYDPETGIFTWRRRPVWTFSDSKFSRDHAARNWNSRWAGKEAFTTIGSHGRRTGGINGHCYLAARVAWKIVYGDEPEEVVTLNGDCLDCSIANLKASARIFSSKHNTVRKDNTSGVIGVSWDNQRNIWKAYITENGRRRRLGSHQTLDRAERARLAAAARLGWPVANVEVAAGAAGATPAAHSEQLVAGGVPQ